MVRFYGINFLGITKKMFQTIDIFQTSVNVSNRDLVSFF